jgi:Collagen triple helix repeat (20 copies)
VRPLRQWILPAVLVVSILGLVFVVLSGIYLNHRQSNREKEQRLTTLQEQRRAIAQTRFTAYVLCRSEGRTPRQCRKIANGIVLSPQLNLDQLDARLARISDARVGSLIVGPPGHSGKVGAGGVRGLRGLIGKPGPAGPRGHRGHDGHAGARGAQGNPGLKGEQGPPGQRGAQGNSGARGIAGPPGARGPAGPAGPVGPRGPTGVSGPPGNPCPTGYTLKLYRLRLWPTGSVDAYICTK